MFKSEQRREVVDATKKKKMEEEQKNFTQSMIAEAGGICWHGDDQ